MKTVYIANRGEIALRVIRSCKELGIKSVVGYSEHDKDGLWLRMADKAVPLTGGAHANPYLDAELILNTAQSCGAEAIHPGYGFLSENAEFAGEARKRGLIFIGPKTDTIAHLGDKVFAKQVAIKAGVPTTESTGVISDLKEVQDLVDKVGLPVLLKASQGGGGRGMRIVEKMEDLQRLFESARDESLKAFNSPDIFCETYVRNPRHIEIQVIGDQHGNLVHLGERECSIQRRHQKLFEEAPSVALTPELRAKIGGDAVKLMKALDYENAGTVEFLLDDQGRHYFMEVNARLQVEHPVTELISGVDLVRAQLEVAMGKNLGLKQEDVQLNGWAFECRINCEDPSRGFVPSMGKVVHLHFPDGPGVRCDSALFTGYTVPMNYDSMVAKLLVWAPTRALAVDRMRRALGEMKVGGLATTISFHKKLMDDGKFQRGELSTSFLDHFDDKTRGHYERVAAAIAALAQEQGPFPKPESPPRPSGWKWAGRTEAAW